MTYVYAIAENPDGPVKIGWAHNPVARLTVLQCGAPSHLKLWHAVKPDDYQSIERKAHRVAGAWRVRGEWFEMTVKEAIQIISDAMGVAYGEGAVTDLSDLKSSGVRADWNAYMREYRRREREELKRLRAASQKKGEQE